MLGDTSLGAQTATVVATPRAPDAAELERGSLLGRYLVLAPLGAGGMGVVYAAFDPELDRKVALKLLRAEPASDVDASVGRARLVREAQALARLNHPNVVAIHDVGTLDDRVWLAIEYIDGQTLSDWLKQRPRRWHEILAVLLDAGRGLAAAHAAGLVHRDLKPENIMIGSDGRVRVMDFGLARASGPQDEAPITRPAALARALDSSVLTAQVTTAGLIIGTPSYMAPEQWAGQALDARVDQFAFCVTLWEALFGERPYTGDTLLELANHIVQGERRTPVRRAHVPAWLHHALARGLHRDPDARFASMDALLAVLASGQTRLRNRRIALGLVMVLLAALAALAWRHHSRDLRLAACDAVGAPIHDTWNDNTRAALKASFQATGVAFANTTYAKLVPWVDRWTGEWSERRRDLCRAQEMGSADDLHDLSVQCLDEHREALAATLDTLVDSDASTVQEAVAMAIDLPRLAACSDPAALARRPAPPSDPELRARVDAVRRDLQRADELRLAGRYTAARELAIAAMPIAEQLAYPPLIARAAVTLGNAAYTAGDLEQAESALILAYTRAGVIGDDNQALAAASQLTYVVGFSAARHAEGLVWSHSAEMLLDRLGLRGSLREADHLDNLASIRLEQGQVDEALTLFTRALELNEHLLSREHPSVAHALSNLATAQITHGDHAAATLGLERSLAIAEREFGPDHPEVATTLNNLAASKRAEGDLEAAHALHLRALALRERVLRPGHPDITTSLNNLADVERQRGDHDQAFAINTRALAILERERGPDHLDIAFSLNNLALVHQERREYDQAIALQDRALQIFERAYGSEHPTVATALNNLGLFHQLRGDLDLAEQLHLRTLALRERLGGPDQFPVGLSLFRLATIHRLRGEFTQAETLYQRALTTWQKVLGADSPELAWPLVGQGQLALARGRPREAVPLIERALRLRGDDTSKPDRLAEARFALAKALVAADKHHDRSRVLALAQEAADAYRGFGDSAALAEVEAWSRTRR
jgi:tetratricopeptide (TPR) repeat protein/tRNA A-37 threonylcarbamoyl transferase component Bud32